MYDQQELTLDQLEGHVTPRPLGAAPTAGLVDDRKEHPRQVLAYSLLNLRQDPCWNVSVFDLCLNPPGHRYSSCFFAGP